MSQAGVVTRLAVRELWITFRLVVLLVAFVGVGAVVALLPAPLAVTMQRLAIGLGAATLLTAAVAAWSIAEERIRGRAGWLVTRSVPRGKFVVGWFVALSSVSLAGLAAAAVLGWLAAVGVALRLAPDAYALLLAAVAATVVAAVALGVLAGSLLRPRPAALLAVITAAVLAAVAWLSPLGEGLAPGHALLQLAAFAERSTPSAAAWRAAGAALLAAAVFLILARLVLQRVEL